VVKKNTMVAPWHGAKAIRVQDSIINIVELKRAKSLIDLGNF
jgi:hypothetical protein